MRCFHQSPLRALSLLIVALIVSCQGLAADLHVGARNTPSVVNPDANIGPLAILGRFVLFSANDGIHGTEVWRYDPRSGVTSLAKDIMPGSAGSTGNVLDFHVWRGVAYFAAHDRENGDELWRSDGTSAGTWMVRDINPGVRGDSEVIHFAAGKTFLYFVANDGQHGYELWKTDGTSVGTRMVRDVHPPIVDLGTTFPPTHFQDSIFFRATSTANLGELWRTDGTPEGTQRLPVRDLEVKAFRGSFVSLGDRFVLVGASPDTGNELWVSDGTTDGTRLLKDLQPGPEGSNASNLVGFKDGILFQATTKETGKELFITDGTSAGTVLLKDIVPGPGSGDPAPFRVTADCAYFTAQDECGRELWVTDGTRHGTHRVSDLYTGPKGSDPYSIAPVSSGVFFSANHPDYGEELWFSDGTAEGTHLVKDINEGKASSEPYHLIELDGMVYFEADDGKHGAELWCSDGTAEGTRLIADIALPGAVNPSSNPGQLTAGPDGLLLFVARNRDGQWRPWLSDGSSQGTQEIVDAPSGLTARSFFDVVATSQGFYVGLLGRESAEIWFVDAKSRTAEQVIAQGVTDPSSLQMVVADGQLYVHGIEGAPDTVFRLGDSHSVLEPVPGPTLTSVKNLTPWASGLILAGNDNVMGEEPWLIHDGRIRRIADICVGPEGSNPANFVTTSNTIFFTADDGTHGTELWKSDGTASGTVMVADINPIQDARAFGPRSLTRLGSELYFVADDGVHGQELWHSNGDASATKMVADCFPGIASSAIEGLMTFGQSLFFRATDINQGTELFVSDGTERGTYLAKDFVEGPESGGPKEFVEFGEYLFFTVATELDGQPRTKHRLWWTRDGRFGSITIPVESAGDDPEALTVCGDTLFFTLDDGERGRELWKVVPTKRVDEFKSSIVKDLLPGITIASAP